MDLDLLYKPSYYQIMTILMTALLYITKSWLLCKPHKTWSEWILLGSDKRINTGAGGPSWFFLFFFNISFVYSRSIKELALMNPYKAAHIFNVPKLTICSHLQGVTPHIEKYANNYILIVSKKETLIKWAFIANKCGLPIWPSFLHGMANILLQKHTKQLSTVSKNWCSTFIKHIHQLKTQYNRRIAY